VSRFREVWFQIAILFNWQRLVPGFWQERSFRAICRFENRSAAIQPSQYAWSEWLPGDSESLIMTPVDIIAFRIWTIRNGLLPPIMQWTKCIKSPCTMELPWHPISSARGCWKFSTSACLFGQPSGQPELPSLNGYDTLLPEAALIYAAFNN
jgi:hypothetical protein